MSKKTTRRALRVSVTFFAAASILAGATFAAPEAKATDAWAGLVFLAGEWVGEGSGAPGQGEGASSFSFDLDRNILVRKSWAKYPPKPGETTGISHEDVMVIYPAGTAIRAIYWDNEKHVIEYSVTVAREGSAVFESDPKAPGPRYRLTYDLRPDGRLLNTFAIAMPGGEYKTYVSGVLVKKG